MHEIFLHPFQIDIKTSKPEIIPEGIIMVGSPEAWDKGITGESSVVAVLDSGCQIDHPDLIDNIIGVYNFTDDDNGDSNIVTDYVSHGTHVAGIIAASSNEIGVRGVAPNAKLLILKVINQKGRGSYDNLIKALNYITKWKGPNGERVSVINISLGGLVDNNDLYKAIKKAFKMGITIVAAAGNLGDNNKDTNEILYPGYYKEVLQVGSIGTNGVSSWFSNSNQKIDFVAPGESILSTYPYNEYAVLSGTSMAAPHVTGIIALLVDSYQKVEKSINPHEILNLLSKRAVPQGNAVQFEGRGLVQI